MTTTPVPSILHRLSFASSMRDQVHIWHTQLDLPDREFREYERTLSDEEQQRAGRFYFPRDSRAFVAAHGFLRKVLSLYIGCDARYLEFQQDAAGKPRLAASFSGDGVHFNLSHSGDIALVAVSIGREVGVDVEQIRELNIEDFLIKDLFSDSETRMLRSVQPSRQAEAFFGVWTRKEAFGKARGYGLTDQITEMDNCHQRDATEIVLKGECWTVRSLNVAPGYIAAVAARGTCCLIHMCEQRTFLAAPLLTSCRSVSNGFAP